MTDARDATRWIPCSERMPGPIAGKIYSEDVLVYSASRPGVTMASRQDSPGHGGGWIGLDCDDVEDVTHWMPLMGPPDDPGRTVEVARCADCPFSRHREDGGMAGSACEGGLFLTAPYDAARPLGPAHHDPGPPPDWCPLRAGPVTLEVIGEEGG